MQLYQSISPITGKLSGIRGYSYGNDYITIYFRSGATYHYTLLSCGLSHLNMMKRLADAQRGLNTYLTKHKPPYAQKY